VARATNNLQDIDPGEEVWYEFNWAPLLSRSTPASGTIVSYSFVPEEGVNVLDEGQLGLVTQVKVSVPGGVSGEVYRVVGKVVTSTGERREGSLVLSIREG
jgi:hypothetical protein